MTGPHVPKRPAVGLSALRDLAVRLADLDAGTPSAVDHGRTSLQGGDPDGSFRGDGRCGDVVPLYEPDGHPNLELYRLPSYSPQLNVIERLWKLLRRRATHNRLFDALPQMCAALRDSLRYYQVMRGRILSMIRSPRRRPKSQAA